MTDDMIETVAGMISSVIHVDEREWERYIKEAREIIRAVAPHYEDRIEAQAAEIERLREALERIASVAAIDKETVWFTHVARAALGEGNE